MKQQIQKDILFWMMFVVLGVVLCGVLWIAIYPYNPSRIDKIEVDKTNIARGERLRYTVIGEKFMDLPAAITIELINGESYPMMSYTGNMPVGKLKRSRTFIIPTHIIPGRYRVSYTGVYPVNGIRHITRKQQSEWITVTPEINHGTQGVQGVQGKQGIQGKPGGISLFGKGEPGPQGKTGRPGKSCSGDSCK